MSPRLTVLFLSIVSLVGGQARAADVTSTLIGSGTWTDDDIWDSALYPDNLHGGFTYDVVVNSNSVDIPALNNIVIESLTFGGGQIGGEGILELNAASTWSGGAFAGGVSTFYVAGSGPLVITGGGYKLYSGAVTNGGSMTWQQGVISSYAQDSTFTNEGIFDLQGDGLAFRNDYGYTGTVVNAVGGTLRRSTGTGTASLSVPIDNQGTIEVQTGVLSLAGGGSSSGVFDVAAGATLDLSGGTFSIDDGASSTGDGVVRVNGAAVDVNGITNLSNLEVASGTLNVIGSTQLPSLRIIGGTVSGSGTLTLTGASEWTGGTLAGPTPGMGEFTVAGTGSLVITDGNYKTYSGAVTNGGSMTWQQGVISSYAQDSTFTNEGIFDLQGDGLAFRNDYGYTGTVVNAVGGTLRRSTGTGTASLSVPIDNQGTIEVQTGVLSLAGGGSSSGVFDVAAGATLDLSGGTFSIDDGASSTGDGVVRVNGAAVDVNGITNLSNLEVASGTLNVIGSTQLPSLRIIGGTVSGSGTLTLTGASEWTGGTLAGPTPGMGEFTVAGTGSLVITDGNYKTYSGAVTNGGSMTWQQGVISSYAQDSTFTNEGIFDLQGDGLAFRNDYGYTGTVVNAVGGTLRRSTGTGTASLSVPIDNQGTIEVQTGVLSLAGGGSSSGVFDVAAGATLDLSGGTFSIDDGASSTGDGVVRVTGATVTFNAAAQMSNLEFAGGQIVDSVGNLSGNLNWTGGELTDGLVLGAGLNTSVVNGGQKFFSGSVTNAGTFNWQQGLVYTGAPDSTFTNTGLVDLQGDGSSFTYNYPGTVNNVAGGTLRRSIGTGTASVTLAVDNEGTIEVDSGILQLAGGGSSSGAFNVAEGAILDLSGTFSLEDGASSTGAGVVRFTNGTLNINGAAQMANLELSGGLVTGGLDLSGNLAWTGGNLADGVVLGSVSTTTVAGGGQKFFSGSVTNAGTFNWQQGLIYTGTPDSTFTNTGLVDLQGDGSSFTYNYPGTVNNAAGGTLRRSIGTGTASVTLAVDNEGTIEVDSGILQLAGGGSSSGAFNVAEGAVLNLGTFTVENGASSSGGGIVRFDGTLTILGTSHLGNLQWDGGTITGGGTLAGTTTVTSGGQKFFSGSVTNAGTFVWQEGLIYNGTPDSTFTNTGLVDLQGDGSSFTYNYPGTVNNAAGGTLRRSVGTGPASITLAVDNQGTIEALSGVFSLDGGLANLDIPTNTLSGGAYRALDSGSGAVLQIPGASVTTIAAGTTVELSGAGATMTFGGAGLATTLANNAGTLRISNGHHFAMSAPLNNSGTVELGGAGYAGGILTSSGDITNAIGATISGHGTINNSINNSGVVRARWGTLAIVGGAVNGAAGEIQVANAASLDLSAASGYSTAKVLKHDGVNLNLGSNDLRVASDYQNANFGVGNAFNPRANVTGSGKILADPAVTQTLSGNVTNGSSATVAMNFGNVHVGDSPTRNYRINNAGGAGPALRGAIHTTSGGANLTDGRLTGAGVSASNFGPIAAGSNSGNLAVTFNATSAGALVNQKVAVVNNFDNVGEQMLTISGAAYRLAQPSNHAPAPVNFGIVHIGDVVQQSLSLTNTTPNDGFSERLNASIGNSTGDATSNGGAFTGLLPGATNSSNLSVGINTSSAGYKSGTATISLTSDGTGSSDLGLTSLTGQTVTVQAQVNNFAVAEIVKVGGSGSFSMTEANSFTLDFGTLVEGVGGLTAELGILNDVAAPADDLAGSFALDAPGFSTSGWTPFSNVAAGTTRGGLFVGLDALEPGDFSGVITLAPRSTNSNPFSMDLPSMTIHLAGFVRRPGDFDNDLDVDGRDFLVWQRGGSPNPGSSGDLAEWQSNYGTSPLSSISTASIPEPTTLIVCLSGLAWAGTRRRFR